MKFKLGLTMTLCVALGTANVAVYANEVSNEVTNKTVESVELTNAEVGNETSGEVVNETADEVVGETAGEVLDETSGEVVDETAGEVVDETAGEVVDETAGEVVEGEIVEIPEEEIPLVEEMPLIEEVQEEATLIIVHKLQFELGEAVQEQVVVGLKAGETVNLADYALVDEEVCLSKEVSSVILVAGENTAEIQYEFVDKAANIDEEVLEEGDC